MKFIYRPFGLIAGLIAGRLALKLFGRIWQTVADEDEAPKAKDRDRTWREVVVAATVQGAVFGGTKAIVDRAGATGYERLTGVWPGREKTKSPA